MPCAYNDTFNLIKLTENLGKLSYSEWVEYHLCRQFEFSLTEQTPNSLS